MMGDPRCNCPPKTEISGVHAKDCPANAPLEEAGEPAPTWSELPAEMQDITGALEAMWFEGKQKASWEKLLNLVARLSRERDEARNELNEIRQLLVIRSDQSITEYIRYYMEKSSRV